MLKSDRLRLGPGEADTWPSATTCRVLGALAFLFAIILALGWIAEMGLWWLDDRSPDRNMVSAAGQPCMAYFVAHCLFSLGRYKRHVREYYPSRGAAFERRYGPMP
jgi:hypothetical protein